MSVYEKLEALNITLPDLTPPVAPFVPFLRTVIEPHQRIMKHSAQGKIVLMP
jgi:hypothetical protein